MEFSEFLQTLPENKRVIYQKVYEASDVDSNETNKALAKRLHVSLNQIETTRHDLFEGKWITPKKAPYRKKSGLPPFRKTKAVSKRSHGFYRTAGLKLGQTRHTFIITEKNLENLRLLSHHDHKNISGFVNDLLTAYFAERKSDLDSASYRLDQARKTTLRMVKF
jgi:hypothetical protein